MNYWTHWLLYITNIAFNTPLGTCVFQTINYIRIFHYSNEILIQGRCPNHQRSHYISQLNIEQSLTKNLVQHRYKSRALSCSFTFLLSFLTVLSHCYHVLTQYCNQVTSICLIIGTVFISQLPSQVPGAISVSSLSDEILVITGGLVIATLSCLITIVSCYTLCVLIALSWKGIWRLEDEKWIWDNIQPLLLWFSIIYALVYLQVLKVGVQSYYQCFLDYLKNYSCLIVQDETLNIYHGIQQMMLLYSTFRTPYCLVNDLLTWCNDVRF